jgi:biotin-dependent carboxylase-like uncharacterized protein
MSAALHVLSAGLATTLQDLGRAGYAQLGIPTGGALDPIALRAANALVGNPQDAGAIEIAYAGPTLVVEAQSVRMAFVGADAPIEVFPDMATGRGRTVATMCSICLQRGEVVRIGSLSRGALLYLAIEGGFAIEPVLGSVSTYLRGGFGGWHGRALVAGDRLPLRRRSSSDREEWRLTDLDLSVPTRLRVIDGPQIDHFAEEEVAAFFNSEYVVCAGDRMAMRLHGRRLRHCNGFDIVSDGTAAGSVQIAGSGEPIVLLADRQTTGGYPKIATIISADLPAAGRLPAGSNVRFERIDLKSAEALRRNLLVDIEGIADRIIPMGGSNEPAPSLLQCNLISGVIDACSSIA